MALNFNNIKAGKAKGRVREMEAAGKRIEKNASAHHVADEDLRHKLDVMADAHEQQTTGEFDPVQQAAVEGILKNKFFVLEGPAGTGKTHVMVGLLPQILEQLPLWDLQAHFTLDGTSDTDLPKPQSQFKSVPSFMCLAWQAKVAANLRNRLSDALEVNGIEYNGKVHASTIHNYLKFAPEEYTHDETGKETVRFMPRYDGMRQSRCSFLLIDEIGTVSEDLIQQLLAASPPNTRIVAMGDISQLPPVAGRPVFPYMMSNWPSASLSKIYRQDNTSTIIPNSQRILAGEMPVDAPDFIFNSSVELPEDEEAAEKFVAKYMIRAAHHGNYDPDTDMLMVHGNDNILGRHRFNEMLKTMGNGPFSPIVERRSRNNIRVRIGRGSAIYTVGDRLVTIGGAGRIPAMPTGTAGIITSIEPNPDYRADGAANLDFAALLDDTDEGNTIDDVMRSFDDEDNSTPPEFGEDLVTHQRQASHILTIACPDLGITATAKSVNEYRALNFNWCGTVHRNQGLEHPRAFIVVHTQFQRYITREWLYTAVTRARGQVVLFHRKAAMLHCLNRRFYSGATPHEKAERFIANQRLRGNVDVDLPENVLIGEDYEYVQ